MKVFVYNERGSKHKKPHCHVYIGQAEYVFDFDGVDITPKPGKKLKSGKEKDYIKTWILVRNKELKKAYNDAIQGKQPNEVPDLK